MIINTLNTNTIKIIIDEVDLKLTGISLKKWIIESNKSFYIKKLLKASIYCNDKLIIKNYNIITYNYKIFTIIINKEE